MNTIESIALKVDTRTKTQTYLLGFALTGTVLFNVVYFSLGAIVPHYNMMRQPISHLMQLQDGWIQSINFIVFGLSICAFAVALRCELQRGFGLLLLPLSHWATGLTMIMAGIFTNEPLQSWLLLTSFIFVLISFQLFAIRFSGDRRWKGWTAYTIVSMVVMIALVARFIYCVDADGPYAGVYERLAVVIRLVWVALFLVQLFDGRKLAK